MLKRYSGAAGENRSALKEWFYEQGNPLSVGL
jgi:hypothetical protein